MNPASSAVDLQGTSIEHLREAGTHVNLRSRRQPVGGGFRRGGRRGSSFRGGGSFSSSGWRMRRI